MSCATCATWKPWSPTKELLKSSPSSSAGTSPGRARSPDQAISGQRRHTPGAGRRIGQLIEPPPVCFHRPSSLVDRGFLGSSRILLVLSADRSGARGRLLEVARRRFAADGAIAATLDEIRRDADVSVGALYHHFSDKPALAAAVYAQLMSEYQGSFVAMLRRQDTAEDGIRGGVAHHLRWVAANRGEAALLLGDRLDSEELRHANTA